MIGEVEPITSPRDLDGAGRFLRLLLSAADRINRFLAVSQPQELGMDAEGRAAQVAALWSKRDAAAAGINQARFRKWANRYRALARGLR